jgi:hypothetical protein
MWILAMPKRSTASPGTSPPSFPAPSKTHDALIEALEALTQVPQFRALWTLDDKTEDQFEGLPGYGARHDAGLSSTHTGRCRLEAISITGGRPGHGGRAREAKEAARRTQPLWDLGATRKWPTVGRTGRSPPRMLRYRWL